MAKHRAEPPRRVRPRYGRIAAAAVALGVTTVALLGGIGLLPVGADPADSTPQPAAARNDTAGGADGPAADAASGTSGSANAVTATGTTLPAGSGTGRRVVFSRVAQRVWLVDAADQVTSTYLVSGSVTDNLRPGQYAVYSRSRWAVGVDDSGVMQYFVRFARGDSAAIGFHSIPSKHGHLLQSTDQLGTPQSHGCIRQKLGDAEKMWKFASVGTDVVVV